MLNWTRNQQYLIPGVLDWNEPIGEPEGEPFPFPTPPGELTLLHTIVTDMADPCTITCMA